jgi:3-isopropylmalate/(R)-2-methylmalate dehydratase small subunit
MPGKAHSFGDNIDTDVIVPGRFLNLSTPEELATVCMAGFTDGYASKIQQGDVFVAGRNFGCGSSREHAPISIKAAGVKCVIAKSFARIFFRNAINVGLPVLESVEAVNSTREGDRISVNLKKGVITNHTQKESYSFMAFSENLIEIISAGGLVNFVNNQRDD